MKTSSFVSAILLTTLIMPVSAAPIGDGFTYQGQLNQSGAPVTQPQDFEFGLYDELSTGTQVGTTNTLTNVAITNGLFSVPLNFGSGAFGNEARYLQINVKSSGSAADYTLLTPRLPITPSPVALSVAANGVNAEALVDGSITREKLAPSVHPKLLMSNMFDHFFPGPPYPFTFESTGPYNDITPVPQGATVHSDGVYLVNIRLKLQSDSVGIFEIDVLVNGAKVGSLTNGPAPVPGGFDPVTFSTTEILPLHAGDMVTVQFTQAPFNFTLIGDFNRSTFFDIIRLD